MAHRTKTVGKLLLQAAISGALIYWIFGNEDLRRELYPALQRADWNWLSAAFAIYGAVEFLGAIRWHFLLRSFGFQMSWWDSTRILLIAIFLNTLLPGLIAGDILRAIYLGNRFKSQKAAAAAVVLVERAWGLFGLSVFGVSVIGWRYTWLHQSPIGGHLADLTLVLVILGVACLLIPWLLRWLPVRDRSPVHSITRFHLGVTTTAVALITTLTAHLCYATSFYCSGRAFADSGPTASFLDMFTVTPIVNTYTSLPLSLSGIGVRESIFKLLLRDLCGVPVEVAVLIGSSGFLIRAAWAVLGCAFLACSNKLQWSEWTFRLSSPSGQFEEEQSFALAAGQNRDR